MSRPDDPWSRVVLDVLYYPVSFVMRAWHALFADVLGPSSGTAWALSVVLLVLTVRALLVRPAWTRMRAARVTRALGPQLTRLRERHAADPRRLATESAALHRAHGVSPVAGLGPMLLQIPVFVALLHVLRSFNRPGLGFAANASLPNYAFAPGEVGSFLRARLAVRRCPRGRRCPPTSSPRSARCRRRPSRWSRRCSPCSPPPRPT